MITIYIPGLAQKSYEYRRGDAQIIHDDNKHAIVIDGGESDLCNKLFAYCRNKGITHITYILTHWHVDHDTGLNAFLDVKGICVDKIYCPPPSELAGLQEQGASDDRARANRRISKAKGLGKPIVYPAAGKVTEIQVGEIKCRIWRRAATRSDKNDYEINNSSMCTYFPDLYYLTTGDTINAFEMYLKTKPDTVKVFKIPHHGNACTTNPCNLLKSAGAELCWYNDWEKKGAAIGSSSFSKWGAGYCKKYFTTLRTDQDIYMTASDGKLRVQKGTSTWSYSVPYKGEKSPGWHSGGGKKWYILDDGTFATGWKQISGIWYYFNPDNGIMLTGWFYDKGLAHWYYLDPSTGAMTRNKPLKVDGLWYFFDGYGQMRTGWYEEPNIGLHYLEPEAGKQQGHMYVKTTATIDGKDWIFDGYGRASVKGEGKYPRKDIVSQAQAYVGAKEGGTTHHKIIDRYNARKPLPRGYAVKYTDAWCATFCSVLAIDCGYTDIIPVECGCPQWITLAKGMGCWTEADTYTPKPGDFILYDWQDSGSGDNTGTPDHIGIVEKVANGKITVIEGNYSDMVKRREIAVNARYIRGYVTPKYSD